MVCGRLTSKKTFLKCIIENVSVSITFFKISVVKSSFLFSLPQVWLYAKPNPVYIRKTLQTFFKDFFLIKNGNTNQLVWILSRVGVYRNDMVDFLAKI